MSTRADVGGVPQGLKPESSVAAGGTAEAVPFHGAAGDRVPFRGASADNMPIRGPFRWEYERIIQICK